MRRTTIGAGAALLLGAALLSVPVAVAWSHHGDAHRASVLRAAFPDIADERWTCTSGDGTEAFLVSCETRGGGPDAPTVNFEALDVPTLHPTVCEGTRPLSSDHWASGTVTRWRLERDPGLGPVYRATYRYATRPFGVTVYARTPDELADVTASLHLPDPGDLPT